VRVSYEVQEMWWLNVTNLPLRHSAFVVGEGKV
jgi:hypothetical protein